MLFERTHSEVSNEFSATVCKSFSFPVHLHRSFEFFGVTRGMACVTVEEKEYTLSAGEAVLIFPYQTHAYANDNSADVVMLIFSPEMVPAFYNHTARKTPLSNLFAFPLEQPLHLENSCLQIALAYKICGTFDQTASYTVEQPDKRHNLLHQLLTYVDKNYKGNCTLEEAAKSLNYDYTYVAKFFKSASGIPFRTYVNRLRIQNAPFLLETTSEPVSAIAEACGFTCVSTFDREFKKAFGMSPQAYRRRN